MKKGDLVKIVSVPNGNIDRNRHMVGMVGRVAAMHVQPWDATTITFDAPPRGVSCIYATRPEHLAPAEAL